MDTNDEIERVVNRAAELVAEAQGKVDRAVARTQLRTSIISGALVLVGVFATSVFQYLSADKGHNIEQTRIALALMSGDTRETSIPARRFALKLLVQSTGVSLDDDDKEAWIASGTIPSDGTLLYPWLTGGWTTTDSTKIIEVLEALKGKPLVILQDLEVAPKEPVE